MKRRSARPFTVEVKHTPRTSRASLTHAIGRTRSGADLWRTPFAVSLADRQVEVPATTSAVTEERQAAVPERRVLPCLVPMFALSSDADTSIETLAATEPRSPRVRRVKAKVPQHAVTVERGTSKVVPAHVPLAAMSEPIATDADREAEPVAKTASAHRSQSRTPPGLRPGERWKRRLPRVLW